MTEPDVKELKAQRSSHRRKFTRLSNSIKDTVTTTDPSLEQVECVQTVLDILERTLKELEESDWNIEFALLKTDEGAATKDAEDACDLLMKNQHAITRGRNFLITNLKKKTAESMKKTKTVTSKLPKLTLPTFSGELTEWLPFWERFFIEIDQHEGLSDVHKFDYLYGLLKGDTLNSVKSIIPSAANYKILKETLVDNFGKSQKIVRAHVLRLFHLDQPSMSGKGLRTYYNQILTDLQSLGSLKINVDSAAALIVPIIEEKLPAKVRCDIADIDRENVYNLDKFLTAFKRQVQRYEIESQNVNLDVRGPVNVMGQESTPVPMAGSFTGLTNSCGICNSSKHGTDRCNLSIKQKKDMVMTKRLCKLCLIPNHVSRSCVSLNRCSTCSGMHHTSMHGVEFLRACVRVQRPRGQRQRHHETDRGSVDTSSVNPVPTGATGTTSCSVVSRPYVTSMDAVMSTIVSESPIVLVKTAKATATYGGKRINVGVFFEEGSQRNYIRQEVASQLGIEPKGYVDLGVCGFHSIYTRDRYGMASIGIVTSDSVQDIPVLITHEIVAPIDQSGWEKATSLPYLYGLELADDFQDRKFVFDVLIGADSAWMFMKDGCVRRYGPTAQMSNIGRLLVGTLNSESSVTADNSIVNLCVTKDPTFPEFDDTRKAQDHDMDKLLGVFCSDVMEDVKCDVDNVFKSEYRAKIEFKDSKYEVPLPWKEDLEELPGNLQLCRKRLDQVVSRLENKHSVKCLPSLSGANFEKCVV